MKRIGDSFKWLEIGVSFLFQPTRFLLILKQRDHIAVPSKLYSEVTLARSLTGVGSYIEKTVA